MASCSTSTEGRALGGSSSSYGYLLSSKCNVPARTMSNGPGDLPKSYNVKYGGGVLGRAATMGDRQVEIEVSWEEVQGGVGLHQNGELWVRVLSQKQLEATLELPKQVADQITPEILELYNHRTALGWHPDLREDDDETIPEWPHEQWWALPRMKAAG